VDDPGGAGALPVLRAGMGAEHHHRDGGGGGVVAELPGQLQPAPARQGPVEQQQRRAQLAGKAQPAVGGVGGGDLVAGPAELDDQQVAHVGVVVDDQDAGRHGVLLSAGSRRVAAALTEISAGPASG
jgi:hypothetical protein